MLQVVKRHWKFFLITFSYVSIEATVRATSLIMEYNGRGEALAAWKPFVWEFSSTWVAFALVPVILMFDERYPISGMNWFKRLLAHIPLSMAFSFIHIVGFVAIRKLIFASVDDVYVFTELNYTIIYEYRKDIMTYTSIMVIIYAYREILRLRNGEAQIEKSDEERIMVTKSGVFKFVEPKSVDWVEAAGNYIELHVGADTYMLRATMKEIESRLGAADFARVHRSTIVNKDQIAGIKPAMNGDKLLILKNGQELRLSRRYSENLKLAG